MQTSGHDSLALTSPLIFAEKKQGCRFILSNGYILPESLSMERTQNMCQSTRTSWPCYRRTALGTTSWTNHLHLVREYTTSFPLTKLRAWDLSCAKISFAQVYAKQVRDICLKCSYRVKKTKSVHPSDEATHNINVYIYIYTCFPNRMFGISDQNPSKTDPFFVRAMLGVLNPS